MSITEGHEGEFLNMQAYELAYLVLPSIPEENLSQVATNLEKIIEKKGGKKFFEDAFFKHKLSYRMHKVVGASRYLVDDAYVGLMKFELSPSHTEEVRAEIDKMPEILRHLIVKIDREDTSSFAKLRESLEKKSGKPEEAIDEDSDPVADSVLEDEEIKDEPEEETTPVVE